MKSLLDILGKDLHDQVSSKLGDVEIFLHEKGQKVVIDEGKFIPQYRLDEVTGKNKNLSEQLTKAENDLKELKKLSVGNEELSKKITDLQTENKTIKETSAQVEIQLKKSLAVKEALMNAGVSDPDARELLLPKFDLSTTELDESGKIKDFDTKLKPIKENKTLATLFGKTIIKGADHKEGGVPEGLYTRAQVDAMSQADVTKNFETVQKSVASWTNEN